MNAWELVQQFDHAVIVFECMHPYPREAIFAGDQVLVEGLVHVPEEDQTNRRHCFLV